MKTSHILILSGLGAAILVALMTGGDETTSLGSAEPNLDNEPSFSGVVADTGAMSDSTSDTLRTLIADNRARDRDYQVLFDKVKGLEGAGTTDESSTVGVLQNQLRSLQEKIAKLESKQDSTDALLEQQSVPDLMPEVLVPKPNETQATHKAQSGVTGTEFDSLVPNLLMPSVEFDGEESTGTKGINLSSGDGVVWIEPSDMIVSTDRDGNLVKTYPEVSTSEIEKSDLSASLPKDSDTAAPIPYVTIPANSSFIDSVAFTAIVGRVPKSGSLVDPYRFRVLVGSENLATNGVSIPGLESVVMGGVAKGDYTMRCVSGDITSVTYTFSDGTISSYETSAEDPLGYIVDEYGVPCVPGEYLSNAAEYLSMKGAMGTVSSIAGALAQGEVTSIAEGSSVASVVTGDSLVHAGGKGVAQGISETSDWLDERQSSAFDAVFLPVGEALGVLIEQEIRIDYQPDGRRVAHNAKEGLL